MKTSKSRQDWIDLARRLSFEVAPFIDGRSVPSRESQQTASVTPLTGEPLYHFSIGSPADVDAAVRSARAAFDRGVWRFLGPAQRRDVLLRLSDLIERNAETLALLDTLEVGKAISNAMAEIPMSSHYLRYCAEGIDKLYGYVASSTKELHALSIAEPRGVVGAIVPWNFPLANSVIKVAPALAAGNCVVLKPSELSALSAIKLAELALDAGVPPGVLNVVPGIGTTVGSAIARHPDIDFISFTGSSRTGREIMRQAGESNGKPMALELGGKSPQIVCADMVDELDRLGELIAHDAFWNQGQWCAARSRLIVEEEVYDKVVQAVCDAAGSRVPGHPLDPATTFGTIASGAQFERVVELVDQARRDGARIVFDGGRGSPCRWSHAPVVIDRLPSHAATAQQEVFGPVLCCFPFSTFEEAITLANDTSYGLAATVWTRDLRRGRAAAQAIRAGKVMVKSSTRAIGSPGFALHAEPWGASGFGLERGLEGVRAYCRMKAIELHG